MTMKVSKCSCAINPEEQKGDRDGGVSLGGRFDFAGNAVYGEAYQNSHGGAWPAATACSRHDILLPLQFLAIGPAAWLPPMARCQMAQCIC